MFQYRYRFGTAEFDQSRLELRVGGLPVEVQRKPLQILSRLLATPGETVSRDALFAEVWNGRATGDAVLDNAISKLRAALGEQNQARLVTVPRQGFRLDGPIERVALGRLLDSAIALRAGEPAPARPGFVLRRRLSSLASHDTWLIERPDGSDRRVLKFAQNGEQLASLKREVTLNRVLHESARTPDVFVTMLDWNFETEPFWIESAYAGQGLDTWGAEEVGGRPRLATLPIEARLALVLGISEAVSSAHEVGVLHKDLKPANVLVAEEATAVRVRLADFGSGHLADPDRLDALQITRLGLTINPAIPTDSGTPLYLAPELLRGQSPDVRSDLYALGVMAYQLLAGDVRRMMAPGWERDITDELLREDLARATDVNPQQRLPSVAEFTRRLRELPARREALQSERRLQAQQAEIESRLSRERARRPWVVAAMLAMASGLGISLWMYQQARTARNGLALELQNSSALNQLMREDLIGAANPALQGRADMTVADALANASSQIDLKFADQRPEVRAGLHGSMQNALSELSRVKEAVSAGRSALAAWARSTVRDRAAMQEVRLRLAVDLVQLSELEEAKVIVQQFETEAGGKPLAPALEARLMYAKSWITGGEFALNDSLTQLEAARRLVERLDESQAPWRDKILFALADNYTMVGRHADGEVLFRQLHADQVRRLGADHARPAYTLVGLGRTLTNQGKLPEARAVFEEAIAKLGASLGAQHRMTLTARDQLATVQMQEGQFVEAAEQWAVAQAGFAALLGEGSSYTITLETSRAQALHRAGQLRESEILLRDALERVRVILPEDSPQTQQIRFALAECLLDRRQRAEAATLFAGLDAKALNLAQQEPDWPAKLARLQGRLARE